MLSQPPEPSDTAAKREAILEEAIRTFAELGFRSADVQLIADRAGVGKGTVYRYFGNKADLFWAATFEVVARLEREILRAMEGSVGVLEKLRKAGEAYGAFFELHPPYLEVFVQGRAEFRGQIPDSHRQHHERIIAQFAGLVQQGIDAGELRSVDARKTVLCIGSLLYGAVVESCYAVQNYTMSEMVRHSLDVFLSGLRRTPTANSQGSVG